MIYRVTSYIRFRPGRLLFAIDGDKVRGVGHLLEELGGGAFRVKERPVGFFPGEVVGLDGGADKIENRCLELVDDNGGSPALAIVALPDDQAPKALEANPRSSRGRRR